MFSNIIITKLNDRMYSTQILSSMFSNQTQIKIIKNPSTAITNTLKNMQKNGLLDIIGSHYWGDYVYKNF